MKKWNNAEITSLEISFTANGNDEWDREATQHQKNFYGPGQDRDVVVGPKAPAADVVTDELS